MSEWISVNDRLPNEPEAVLAYGGTGSGTGISDDIAILLYWSHNRWEYFDDGVLFDAAPPTHWMPLPKPPQVSPKDQSEVMAIKPKVLLCFPGDTATALRILSQQ